MRSPVGDSSKRTVTRLSSPRAAGMVCRKARMTRRPNSSFSPERVMSGGRTAAVERPEGAAKLGGKSSCKASLGLAVGLALSCEGWPTLGSGKVKGAIGSNAGAGGAASLAVACAVFLPSPGGGFGDGGVAVAAAGGVAASGAGFGGAGLAAGGGGGLGGAASAGLLADVAGGLGGG